MRLGRSHRSPGRRPARSHHRCRGWPPSAGPSAPHRLSARRIRAVQNPRVIVLIHGRPVTHHKSTSICSRHSSHARKSAKITVAIQADAATKLTNRQISCPQRTRIAAKISGRCIGVRVRRRRPCGPGVAVPPTARDDREPHPMNRCRADSSALSGCPGSPPAWLRWRKG